MTLVKYGSVSVLLDATARSRIGYFDGIQETEVVIPMIEFNQNKKLSEKDFSHFINFVVHSDDNKEMPLELEIAMFCAVYFFCPLLERWVRQHLPDSVHEICMLRERNVYAEFLDGEIAKRYVTQVASGRLPLHLFPKSTHTCLLKEMILIIDGFLKRENLDEEEIDAVELFRDQEIIPPALGKNMTYLFQARQRYEALTLSAQEEFQKLARARKLDLREVTLKAVQDEGKNGVEYTKPVKAGDVGSHKKDNKFVPYFAFQKHRIELLNSKRTFKTTQEQRREMSNEWKKMSPKSRREWKRIARKANQLAAPVVDQEVLDDQVYFPSFL